MTEHFHHVLPLVFLCVHDHEFLRSQVLGLNDTPLSQPWSSLWTTIEMKMTTMWPHFFCVLCFTVCVMYCVCLVYCLNLSIFMSIISLHVVNLFLAQLHYHFFPVLLTKMKPTLHQYRYAKQTFLYNYLKVLSHCIRWKQIYELFISCCGCTFATLFCTSGLEERAVRNSWDKMC